MHSKVLEINDVVRGCAVSFSVVRALKKEVCEGEGVASLAISF